MNPRPDTRAGISITPLELCDIHRLIELAKRIWHACYPGIITIEQIDYMLAQGYTDKIIRTEINGGIA